MRINKYLASCGIASRRKCEDFILKGAVKVNGEVIKDLSFTVDEDRDYVMIFDKIITLNNIKKKYYMLNKPCGVISAASSDHGDITVVDLIKDSSVRLYPVGRLDKDTEGLILLTNDGDFAYHLTHPKFEKRKVYEALVEGILSDYNILQLIKGVFVDNDLLSAKDVKIIKKTGNQTLIQIIITEGKNRQIRKMLASINHKVIKLTRVEEAGLKLGDLKPGEYRELSESEVMCCLK